MDNKEIERRLNDIERRLSNLEQKLSDKAQSVGSGNQFARLARMIENELKASLDEAENDISKK